MVLLDLTHPAVQSSEKCACEVIEAAGAQVLPRLTEKLSAWDPLADPAEGTADFAVWRPLLESESQRDAIFQVLPRRRSGVTQAQVRLCS